jgi:hypothetical protein
VRARHPFTLRSLAPRMPQSKPAEDCRKPCRG